MFRWLPIMTSRRKDKQSWMLSKHTHIPDNDYWGMSVSCRVNHFFWVQLFLRGTQGIYFYLHPTYFSSTEQCAWVQILGHTHIICITVRENRIICCPIFCDLLLKSAFERIFNVMQLILAKIKWKYLIQKIPRYLPFILLKSWT